MKIAKLKTALAVLSVAAVSIGGGAALVHYAAAQGPAPAGNVHAAAAAPFTVPAAPAKTPVAPAPVVPAVAVDPIPAKPPVPPNPVPPIKPAAKEQAPLAPPQPRPIAPPAPTSPGDTADGVWGIVRLDGKAPDMPVIDMSGVEQCVSRHQGQVVTEQTVRVGKDGGLANVVVSVKTPDGLTLPNVKRAAAVLDQKGCLYEPHVLAMQAGDKLMIQNSDPFLHNVHSQSETDPFNFAQPMVGKKAAPAPKQAEYFHVKCDVHPWMSAWIAVLDNGYFAVTDANGKFELPKGLPDGEYKVAAWHEKYDPQEGSLTVKDGKGRVDFVFKADSR